MMVSCQAGGRRFRMRSRSCLAASESSSLLRKAARTARRCSQDLAMGVAMSEGRTGTELGAVLLKVSSIMMDSEHCWSGRTIRRMPNCRKASTEA